MDNNTNRSVPPANYGNLAANVQDLRFEAIFREIQALLAGKAIPVILLKGPHLAHAYYDCSHERIYGDLDILVKPMDFHKAARILTENRYKMIEEDDRNLATVAQTNHWAFRSRFGQLIELHRGFTGLNRHPVNLDEWFARAVEFQYGQTAAKGLTTEDLLCHLCIHIGKSFFYFIENKHIRDLDVVMRKKEIDWHAFIDRCHETRSKAIAFYCLSAAIAHHDTPIPEDVLASLRPGHWRRKWLDRHLKANIFPIYRFYDRGMEHARKRLTLPLLDGVFNWLPFLARAAWVKGMDMVLRVPLAGKIFRKKTKVIGDG